MTEWAIWVTEEGGLGWVRGMAGEEGKGECPPVMSETRGYAWGRSKREGDRAQGRSFLGRGVGDHCRWQVPELAQAENGGPLSRAGAGAVRGARSDRSFPVRSLWPGHLLSASAMFRQYKREALLSSHTVTRRIVPHATAPLALPNPGPLSAEHRRSSPEDMPILVQRERSIESAHPEVRPGPAGTGTRCPQAQLGH
jgi:hypothetical protein